MPLLPPSLLSQIGTTFLLKTRRLLVRSPLHTNLTRLCSCRPSTAGASTAESEARIMASLEELRFDNRALKSLPIDEETGSHVRSVAGQWPG